MRLCLLVGLMALAACQTVETVPAVLSAAELQAVQGTVAAAMKDPSSAIFGRVAAGRTREGVALVCGMVNGRNSFGAYAGESVFAAWHYPDGRVELIDMAGDFGAAPSAAVAIVANCRANGVAI